MSKSSLLSGLLLSVGLLWTGALWATEGVVVGDPVVGKQKAFMCKGCHNKKGYKTAYPKVYEVPRLGGQHAEYLISALQQYRSGERSFATMRAMASSLTDQDIADMAAYYSLHTDN